MMCSSLTSAPRAVASWRTTGRARSDRFEPSSGNRMVLIVSMLNDVVIQALRSLIEERLVHKKGIHPDDDRRDSTHNDGRDAMIDENAHQIAAAREHHQRDQGEWNTEREYHLTDHERASGIESQGDHDQCRHHRDATPHPEW